MTKWLDTVDEKTAAEDEARRNGYRIQAATAEYERQIAPVRQAARLPYMEQIAAEAYEQQIAPEREAARAAVPQSFMDQATAAYEAAIAPAREQAFASFAPVSDEPDLSTISEPLLARYPREQPKPVPDILVHD